MIHISSVDWIRDNSNAIAALPMFGGRLTLCKITGVEGDEVTEDGHKTLIYKPDGTLAKNYVMCFIYNDGTSKLVSNGAALSALCEFTDEDAEILHYWLLGLDGTGSGIPIVVSEVEIDNVKTLVFGNLYEYYAEMEKEEADRAYKAAFGDNDVSKDAADEFERTFQSTYAKLTKAYPDMQRNCDTDMYARSILAKLGAVIQKRYNQIHFDDVIREVAKTISDVRYFNDNGEIVPLSITALENMFSKIKDEIRISSIETGSKTDPKSAYKNN